MSRNSTVTAFAPATVANVAVGFDVLGFALDGVGDHVTVRRDPGATGPMIETIEGVVTDLPTDPERNTATVALAALAEDRGLTDGFRVSIRKGIPLGSGMGGSAASAVGAVVAANALLDRPLPPERLLGFAMAGERVASGAAHADNAAPCLFGGMTAVVSNAPPRVASIPIPPGVACTLVHPHLEVETRQARAALRTELPLTLHVRQSMRLAGFLAGCFEGNARRVAESMEDLVAEPTRSRLIPGFTEARRRALEHGALGFGISGSGPSVFAWSVDEAAGRAVEREVRATFESHGLASDGWVVALPCVGARSVGGRG